MNPHFVEAFPDEVLNPMDQYFLNGLKEGAYQSSLKAGYDYGRELGSEVGYYTAIVEGAKKLINLIEISSGTRKEKLTNLISELEKRLLLFEVNESTDPNLEEKERKEILMLRGKMKVLCSLLGIRVRLQSD